MKMIYKPVGFYKNERFTVGKVYDVKNPELFWVDVKNDNGNVEHPCQKHFEKA